MKCIRRRFSRMLGGSEWLTREFLPNETASVRANCVLPAVGRYQPRNALADSNKQIQVPLCCSLVTLQVSVQCGCVDWAQLEQIAIRSSDAFAKVSAFACSLIMLFLTITLVHKKCQSFSSDLAYSLRIPPA